MTTPQISPKTAQTVADLVKTLAAQNMVPRSEAEAAARLLRAAAKPPPGSPRSTGHDRPRLVTTCQAAERLACSRKTVLRMADDKLLTRRYLREGNAKSLRFLEAEVAAICASPGDEAHR